MPLNIDTTKAREAWTVIAAAFSFLLGIAGAGAMVQKVKGDIKLIKNAVLDEKGRPSIVTMDEFSKKCSETRSACNADRHDRRTESREDLSRELQNIYAAIRAQNEQFKTIAGEVAELSAVVGLLSKNISISMGDKT
jgi:biopolymer transport protein ExbB/TolQ